MIKTFRTQAAEFSADVFNVANLLNKNWDATKTLGKQNIYSLRSFDPTARTFNYDVNPNAGVIMPLGNPYQIQLDFRYSF